MAFICVLAFFALDNNLTLTEYTFASERLPESFDGYKILAVCDLHSQEFGGHQSELIECINAVNPDIIVLLGDIIDAKNPLFEPLENLLSGIYSDYTIYAISGNHENALSYSDFTTLKKLYSSYSVTFLRDEGIELSLRDSSDSIMLWGGDDPPVWNDSAIDYIAENGLGVSPTPGMFNIFLYHRANLFPEVYKHGFDLVLSAHLHGGQVRLPLIGGLVSPTRKWFPNYTAGIYTKANSYAEEGLPDISTMIVGRGLGNTAEIPRIFNPPEIFTVTLRTGS